MANIDWAKLVAQNRAKAYGVSWSNEEANAIYQLKIPADYVRKGILTLEAYEKAKGSLPVGKTKEELMAEAKKEGIAVTPDATKESLEKVLADKKAANKPAAISESPKEVMAAPKEKPKAPAKKPAVKSKAKPAKKAGKR